MLSGEEPWLSNFRELVEYFSDNDFEEFKSCYREILEDPRVDPFEKEELFEYLEEIKLKCVEIHRNLNAFELLEPEQDLRKSRAESILELYHGLITGLSQPHHKSIRDLNLLASYLLTSLQELKDMLPKTFSNIQSDI